MGGHACEAETVRSCHPLSASYVGVHLAVEIIAVRADTADGVETASFLDHRYAGIVIYPRNDGYAGIVL